MENFIRTWYLTDLSLCDLIINYHKLSKNKESGVAYDDLLNKTIYNPAIKDSIDVELDLGTQLRTQYIEELSAITGEYTTIFPYCNWSIPWGLAERINIQYYPPGGGFKVWHCERSNGQYPGSIRHLVFMTYLNDVDDAGETEFYHQQVKIKPRKGLTVIWPADWTYTHRGIPSPSQEKYIITGWLSFLDGLQEQPVKIKL
jgi:hypothetical protein